jgi:hypothetical protein
MIMEAKFNIAEILKDKPQGTKLYDWLYNRDVELDTISTTDTETVVWCTNKTDNNTTCHRGYSEFGTVRGCPDGLQILFPSKEMRDWRKFNWKKGDVLVSKDNVHIIFEKFENDAYTRFKGKHYLWKECDEEDYAKEETYMLTFVFEKANDDAAQTYIKTIEEKLGGKLNRETLEIEKTQPEFKDGDILASTSSLLEGDYVFIFNGYDNHNDLGYYVAVDNDSDNLYFSCGNVWCYKGDAVRYATEEEKQRLFEALAKEGKAWDAEKKAIVDLKPKCEFKPFDRCIWKIRNCEGSIWQASFVSYVDEYGAIPMGVSIDEDLVNLIILPYNEETAKLIGTTNNWEG